MFVKSWLLLSFFSPLLIFGQFKGSLPFDPTGTYVLNDTTVANDGEVSGYFGEIKLKALANKRIAVTLYAQNGGPAYSSGTLSDTLKLKGNVATYYSEEDSTCRITFYLKKNKIIVNQVQRDPNFGCGFGHGVFADGEYVRINDNIPIIEEPNQPYHLSNQDTSDPSSRN